MSYFCTFAPVAFSGFFHSVIYLFNVGTVSHSVQNKRHSLVSITPQNMVLIRNMIYKNHEMTLQKQMGLSKI